MEETVWLAYGFLAVVIGIGIVISILTMGKEDSKSDTFRNSLKNLEVKCTFVCRSPPDTLDSVDVELPSGLFVYTKDKKICGRLNQTNKEPETNCVICSACDVSSGGLNLDTDIAKKTFVFHKYTCFFNRTEYDIKMECQG